MPPSYIIQNREGVCRAAELYHSAPEGCVSRRRAILFSTGRRVLWLLCASLGIGDGNLDRKRGQTAGARGGLHLCRSSGGGSTRR
eukprot:54505-Prorocentrum_minimum.AAC.1